MATKRNKIEDKKITDLIPDSGNANLGTERGLRALDDSLGEVGLGRSVVTDKHGRIIAGNKTVERAADRGFEDTIVVHTTGDKLVVVQRDDLDLSDSSNGNKARALAYFDNRVAELDLHWNPVQLQADKDSGIEIVDKLWSPVELEILGVGDGDAQTGSDGSLLALTDVTIDDPKTIVEHGDVWKIKNHFLICADVVTEHRLWSSFISDDCWFLPYPGIYAAMTVKAQENDFVMVQPDPYIAGHIIDRFIEINGSDGVSKYN